MRMGVRAGVRGGPPETARPPDGGGGDSARRGIAPAAARGRVLKEPNSSPRLIVRPGMSFSISSSCMPNAERVRGMPSETKKSCSSSMVASTASATARSGVTSSSMPVRSSTAGSTGSMPKTWRPNSRKRSGCSRHT